MNKLISEFTGYRPPSWLVNLTNWIVSLFSPHPLTLLSSAPYPAQMITDISAIPVFMQALQPDCVENAVTFAKMYYDWKKSGTLTELSPRFLFNVSNPSENGTILKVALEEARTKGICENLYMINDTSLEYDLFVSAPSQQAISNAKQHTISAYMMTTNVKSLDLRSLINQFGIVIIGCEVDNHWWLPSWNTLTLPLIPPAPNSPTLSYHCVVLYGYDAQGNFYGRNWWSNAWANAGNFTINEAYLPSIYEVAALAD